MKGRDLTRLKASGRRVDALQRGFVEVYTASHNAHVCASLFDITKTNALGNFNSERNRATRSLNLRVFSWIGNRQTESGRMDHTDDEISYYWLSQRFSRYDISKENHFGANMTRNFHRR